MKAQQVPLIEIGFGKTRLVAALQQLTKQGYFFTCNYQLLERFTIEAVPIAKRSPAELLDLLLKNTGYTYEVKGYNIVIYRHPEKTPTVAPVVKELCWKGRVTDAANHPLQGATIRLNNHVCSISNEQGEFVAAHGNPGDCLQVEWVGLLPFISKPLYRDTVLQVVLRMDPDSNLEEVEVQTGFQSLPKNKPPGATAAVTGSLLRKPQNGGLLNRLEGNVPGLMVIRNIQEGSLRNEGVLSLDGRTTIHSNPNLLVVLNNFKFTGAISDINPLDIASITVLKDAAAAAMWGELAGNGVIVITTRSGYIHYKPSVTVAGALTLGQRPNLYATPYLNSRSYLEVESFVAAQQKNSLGGVYTIVSPAAQILWERSQNKLTAADSAQQWNSLAQRDIWRDVSRLYYRPSVLQQYAVNVSGGGKCSHYYYGVGYSANRLTKISNTHRQLTLTGNHTWCWWQGRVEMNHTFLFRQLHTQTDDGGQLPAWPYLQLADPDGKALAVPFSYAQGFKDSAGLKQVLDWNYRPLEDIRLSDHRKTGGLFLASTAIKLAVTKELSASISYQLTAETSEDKNYLSPEKYFVRNLVNVFSVPDYASGRLLRQVPEGAILNQANIQNKVNDIRVLLQFARKTARGDSISVLAGWDEHAATSWEGATRWYHYQHDQGTGIIMDNAMALPTLLPGVVMRIPSGLYALKTINNARAYYGQFSYSLRDKYTAKVNIRRDASNLYKGNESFRGRPLWAIGLGWNICKEAFYHYPAWPRLTWRASYGFLGNANNTVSNATTMNVSGAVNRYGEASGTVLNPANSNLRWEKVSILNTGLEFTSGNKRWWGSVEWYEKQGRDLIGEGKMNPTLGVQTYTGNTARMKTWGWDISLGAQLWNTRRWKWQVLCWMSLNKDKVTYYWSPDKKLPISAFLRNAALTPRNGFPLYGGYGYVYYGLNSEGETVGRLNGNRSTAYNLIAASSDFDNLRFMGSLQPTRFGSCTQRLEYKDFGLQIQCLYKGGYVFRRTGVDYTDLFAGGHGHTDVNLRWQKPGDELHTIVPRMVYPANQQRDDLYLYSDAQMQKGDHLRVKEVQLSWDLRKEKYHWLPFNQLGLYTTVSNVGILWRANHYGIDPDAYPYANEQVWPEPRNYTIGFTVNL
ncbi:TonB-dependent receptor plug domain-containing protein [Filimonas lacunae]|uniref:TonB-dependent receptor plug domain-containing protein n=1 Tax=Filimonas lacunae TaxID=477680 RepID=UPI0007D7209C|nr:TonB-dependent receptor plug domain-containing protein [Filimonas lacunae]BAV07752.1 TonB-dependent receptor [Filimonas lacunae]